MSPNPRESPPSHVVVSSFSTTTERERERERERNDLKSTLFPSLAMNPPPLLLLPFFLVATFSTSSDAAPLHRIANVTVLGSVYCDACSSNNFSKNSYFLRGALVLVQCKFAVNSTSAASREEMSITAYRTTDRFGVYELDVPPVDGFECREGKEIRSMCRATLLKSPSKRCNVAGFSSATAHVAVKDRGSGVCYCNLNALSYRPARRSVLRCGEKKGVAAAVAGAPSSSSSLIFWPILPPFGLPWPNLPFPFPFLLPPSLPFPFPHIPWPDPASLPFHIPSWLLPFLQPPFFPSLLPPTPSPPASSSALPSIIP
ncbi:proline-rich protein 4-like [Canna indica]|uniref:Proline-rich protein 4-like n=1 Tax=Canna indica TaxID=4628 RepID=A0AAQ3K884_9LILI|nr:proline-rich protein 4-like [Canna indica]